MNAKRINHSVWYAALLMVVFCLSCLPQSLKGQSKVLAYWRFEQIVKSDGDNPVALNSKSIAEANQRAAVPLSYGYDETGRGNLLQWRGSNISASVISSNVPARVVNGQNNTSSLSLKNDEYVVALDRPLDYYNMQKGWTIEASLMCNWLWEDQVYLCKEGLGGQLAGDVSIGFDNTLQQYFVEVTCVDGVARRVAAGQKVEAGKWYDVRAHAEYDQKENRTKLVIEVKPSGQKDFEEANAVAFKGPALPLGAGRWVIGRGYPGTSPNHLAVIDGGIDEVKISGEALPRVAGQNPLFTDAFTADPSTLVDGNTLYVYAGEDKATPGGWFDMPGWRCYSTVDMKHWTEHGTVLQSKDFQNAFSGASWASQVVKKDGKYYFYVTVDGKNGHFITVAVGDSPTGPFKEATPGKPLITDDMTKDSHRPNADIDPTIFIDDDGTPVDGMGQWRLLLSEIEKEHGRTGRTDYSRASAQLC